MKSLLNACLGLALVTASLNVAPKAEAAIIDLGATLSGAQQVPPVSTPGNGSAILTLDTDTNLFNWNISFSDLTATPIMAHFHGPAPIGQNAGVQVDIASISGLTSPLINSATVDNTQEQQILNGLWYINIHTTNFPGGEIRGQVLNASQIPEPTSIFTILTMGGLSFRAFKKKQKHTNII